MIHNFKNSIIVDQILSQLYRSGYTNPPLISQLPKEVQLCLIMIKTAIKVFGSLEMPSSPWSDMGFACVTPLVEESEQLAERDGSTVPFSLFIKLVRLMEACCQELSRV